MIHLEQFIILDHQLGDDKLVMCRVYGEPIKEDDVSIVLRYWACCDIETGEDLNDDHNDEYITIIKSAIVNRFRVTGWVIVK